MRIFIYIYLPLSALLILLSVNSVLAEDYQRRVDVQAYIDHLVEQHAFDRAYLEHKFKLATKQERAIVAMDKPAEAKPWPEYKDIFITPLRISGGVLFWQQNKALLSKAEMEFGVPASLIVAIIGVETYYGKNTGSFPVFSTLVTLGFDYPRRADFFKRELTEFLLLCRQESALQCDDLKGSYAGAMGVGQFISSSYRSYAIDFDNDGIRDLWNSRADVIGSIANYIKRHGWMPAKPVGEYIELSGGDYELLLNKQFKPWLSLADLAERNITVGDFQPKEPIFSLFKFEKDNFNADYKVWTGYNNFYVITRYNHSHLYAMVIHQLSRLIEQQH
ncbi:MAG: lytic murein transglycosylase B [Chromatiales bacterium]|nr:lytic murein transglycosylase B [Chromatiales bacterium]